MTITRLPRRITRAVPSFIRQSRRPDGAAPRPRVQGGGLRGGFTAMRHRNYRIYWFGQIGSLVGAWMQSVAHPWLVLQLGGSPLQLGSVLALMFAPSMVLAPIGGVLADRVDKRRTLMVVNAVAMLNASILFGLTITGAIQIWHLYVLALSAGFVNAVEMPVRQAFAAELVPQEDLVNAIALNSTSFNLSRVIGPALAGVLIAGFGVGIVFGLNALSYLSVLIGLWRLHAATFRRAQRPETFPSVRSSLAEGIRYAVATPAVLWPLVLLGGMATLAMNFQTLLPVYARDDLGMDSGGYGALFAAMGAGSLLGSLLLAFVARRRVMFPLIVGGGAVFLAMEVALGLFRSPLAAFGLVVGIGFASMLMVNTINVTIQNSVPDALRGRVMSLYVMVFAGTAPIGGLFAGAMAQAFGAAAGFVVGASLGIGVLGLVAWRLRSVEEPRGFVVAREGATSIGSAERQAA
jgi:MFS family permease